jgi:hypothetical protein
MDAPSFVKPTINTPYHIDFEWWKKSELNWRVMLMAYLSNEDQQAFEKAEDQDRQYDIIDSETGEVISVDALQHLLISKYAQREGFIDDTTSMVEAIFRLFLANGNYPMTAEEIGERLNRPPTLVLQMLSGRRIYQGIKPYVGSR